MKRVIIYTDGSCLGNPGAGGWSAILALAGSDARKELCGGYQRTTNNRMELMAAIMALSALTEPCEVLLHSDSQYLCNAVEKGWLWSWQKRGWKKKDHSRVPNTDLWLRLISLLKIHRVSFVWLRGHAGDGENERCDALARSCAQQPNLPPDENYENRL